VNTYKTTKRGKQIWIADLGRVGGKRKRIQCGSRREAELAVENAGIEQRLSGELWVGLSAPERVEVAAILQEMGRHGVSLSTVWRTYLDAQKGPPRVTMTLAEAIKETISVKTAARRRPRYVEGLQDYLNLFARGREEMGIHRITPATIDQWFAGRSEAPHTRSSNTGRLASMFALAARRGWISDNPIDRLERVHVETKSPAVLSSSQAKRILAFTLERYPKCCVHLVLALFAGIRPEELLAIQWDCIRLQDGTVEIGAAASKVRRRRVVQLEPAAVKWLELAKSQKADLPLTPGRARVFIRKLRGVLGFRKWPQDILRHTAASYLVAKRKDLPAVAYSLGNSPGVLLRSYHNLVSSQEAERFWGLLPDSVGVDSGDRGAT